MESRIPAVECRTELAGNYRRPKWGSKEGSVGIPRILGVSPGKRRRGVKERGLIASYLTRPVWKATTKGVGQEKE